MAKRKPATKQAPTPAEVKALQSEVVALKARVAELQKKPASSASKWHWRGLVIWLCVILATLLLVVGNVFFWTGNTIVNTDRFSSVVDPLITKPPIQSAMAQYTTTQIFNNVDVQHYVQQVLPPRADFLAPQLTSQLKSHTQSSLQSVLASPEFQSRWNSSLAKTHQALISYSKSYQGNGTILVSDVFEQLTQQLSDTKLSFLSNVKLPSKVGSIEITTVGWLPALHKITTHIGAYQLIASLLFLASLAGAIFLSPHRRRMVIRLSALFAVFMLLTLIAVRIAGSFAVSDVAPAYQDAVKTAYDTVVQGFRIQTAAILFVALLVMVVAWLSGPYTSAVALKRRTTALLSGRLHQSVFGGHENGFTRWVGVHKRYLEWGSVLVWGLVMLVVNLSPKLVVVYGLLMLLSVLVVEFLSAEAPQGVNRSGSVRNLTDTPTGRQDT